MNKVLFILRLPPPYGGGEIASEILFKGLKHHKNFYFLCFSRKGHSKSKQAKISFLSFFYGVSYLSKVFIRLFIFRPDIVYLGLPKSFFAFLRSAIIIYTCSIFKIKIFAELHGEAFLFENNNFKRSILKSTLERCYKIRVLGENIKGRISHYSKKPEFYVIPNGVDIPENIKPNVILENNPAVWQFLYFGAISASKGFFDFAELFNRLLDDKIENFSLNVIGEWVSEEEYKLFLDNYKNKKIADKINFLGLIKGDQKWNAISHNHFLVHLSRFDGQPMTILETMSIGIPAIVTPVGAIPEMIMNEINGFIVSSVDNAFLLLKDILTQKCIEYSDLQKNSIEIYNSRFRSELMVNNIYKAIC